MPQAIECNGGARLASDTFFFCAQEAIQLHGGVGFTWEYDPSSISSAPRPAATGWATPMPCANASRGRCSPPEPVAMNLQPSSTGRSLPRRMASVMRRHLGGRF